MTHRYKNSSQDKQPAHSGKSANDTNKLGHGTATQDNQGRRTPESRHDREAQIGNNQSKMRAGSPQGGGNAMAPNQTKRGRGG